MYLPENLRALRGLQAFTPFLLGQFDSICSPDLIFNFKVVHVMLDTASMMGGPD